MCVGIPALFLSWIRHKEPPAASFYRNNQRICRTLPPLRMQNSSTTKLAACLLSCGRVLYITATMKRLSKQFVNFLPSLAIAAGMAWLFSGCGGATSSVNLSSQAAPPTRVSLAAGDTVRLTFSGAPELNQAQKIRADGKLSLPLIGEYDAAGKTVSGLQGELSTAYKSQLKNSDVLVTLENAPATVTISGAVAKPDRIAFDKPTTIFQAIMQAGGPTPFGNMKAVRLVRTVKGVQQSQVFNLTPVLRGEPSKPFYVRDGDIIFIPQTMF
jgi:polysaccharide export outer membrane protein